jgi:hypothetical protein
MATIETPQDDVIRRNIPRELPCKLTDEEFTRIARQRATKEAERDELVDDLAREKKKRQDQIDDVDDEISKMGRELHTGFQERTIKCVEVFRKGPDGVGYVHTLRVDTYEEVERRPATAHETQRHLPSVEGGVEGGTGGILDTARERQRTAQPDDGSDVPSEGDAPESEEGGDKPSRKRGKKSEQ